MYERCGFVQQEYLPRHYSFGGKEHDAWCLVRYTPGTGARAEDCKWTRDSQRQTRQGGEPGGGKGNGLSCTIL